MSDRRQGNLRLELGAMPLPDLGHDLPLLLFVEGHKSPPYQLVRKPPATSADIICHLNAGAGLADGVAGHVTREHRGVAADQRVVATATGEGVVSSAAVDMSRRFISARSWRGTHGKVTASPSSLEKSSEVSP